MNTIVNAKEILTSYGIKSDSVVKAIQQVGEDIGLSSDPLGYANSIISDLGGSDQYDLASARIMAKAMVEQAIVQDEYNTGNATKIAEAKLEKIRTNMPYVFVETESTSGESSSSTSFKPVKQPRSNDKKAVAKGIFDANKDKTNGEIAQLIQKELKITYANAYYYVSRVFKR